MLRSGTTSTVSAKRTRVRHLQLTTHPYIGLATDYPPFFLPDAVQWIFWGLVTAQEGRAQFFLELSSLSGVYYKLSLLESP